VKTTKAQFDHRRKIHAAAIASEKLRVAWECPYCEHRHAWRWERDEVEILSTDKRITMHCDACSSDTWVSLEQIGARTWAGVWNER
jgi:transposase-like protein